MVLVIEITCYLLFTLHGVWQEEHNIANLFMLSLAYGFTRDIDFCLRNNSSCLSPKLSCFLYQYTCLLAVESRLVIA